MDIANYPFEQPMYFGDECEAVVVAAHLSREEAARRIKKLIEDDGNDASHCTEEVLKSTKCYYTAEDEWRVSYTDKAPYDNPERVVDVWLFEEH